MEPIQIQSIFLAPTEGFLNEPSPQDADRLLSEPLLASPNPMFTAEWMPSYSQTVMLVPFLDDSPRAAPPIYKLICGKASSHRYYSR